MIKKVLATGAVAASILGFSATQAMAIGNDTGTTSINGNGAEQEFGNSKTEGDMSPQLSLVQGTLNKPCIALPIKANIGSLLGAVPINVQDVNILSNPQNQQCTDNSTQAKGDEPLSHILTDIAVLTADGAGNG